VIAVLTSSVNSPICSSAPVENGGSLVVEAGRDPQIVGTANVVLPNWLADELCSSGEGTIALSLGERTLSSACTERRTALSANTDIRLPL
jgi:hypothetical protein